MNDAIDTVSPDYLLTDTARLGVLPIALLIHSHRIQRVTAQVFLQILQGSVFRMYVLLGMQLGFLKEPWIGLALIEPYTNDVVFVNHCCAVRASESYSILPTQCRQLLNYSQVS